MSLMMFDSTPHEDSVQMHGFGKKVRVFWRLALLGAVGCSSADTTVTANPGSLGPFLDSLSVEHEVPGFAFAVFDDTGTLDEYVSGLKSGPDGEALDRNTVFEAASISKTIFAYLVLTLVRDGVLELDTPLTALIPEVPEVGYDSRAAMLTPRMLLTHQGGLPNWRSRLNLSAQRHADLFASEDTLRFVGEPGEEFRYSGEGYVLLQTVLEQVTERSLPELAQERIFDPLGMARTSFRFDSKSKKNFSYGHNDQGRPNKWQLEVALASSTLHTTAGDLARFGTHLAKEVRRDGPDHLMSHPAVTLSADSLVHGWGVGVGTVAAGPQTYLYHGGNNVIFIADFIYGVSENVGYVLLTNSSNGSAFIEPLERRIFGLALDR